MVEFISSWVEQITIAVVIASIFELLLPNSKIKKYVKTIIGIYIIFNIISPFIDNKEMINLEKINIQEFINEQSTEPYAESQIDQTSMDSRLKQLYIKEIEKDVSKKIEEEGYEVKSCKVDAILEGGNEKTGIIKIDLKIKKNSGEKSSSIQSIEKVEININEKEEVNNSKEISHLKSVLSLYYEIDESIINIKELN